MQGDGCQPSGILSFLQELSVLIVLEMLYRGKNLAVRLQGRVYHCALDITMNYLGGKWKAVVLWYLRERSLRFGELRRLMPEITEKMLSLQLKRLEADGLLHRRVYAEVPPRVEYSLSKEGRSLIPALQAMARWGRRKGESEGKIIKLPVRRKKKAKVSEL
jgi:DNA-binding HxlR family transcriptional regulator